MRLIKKKLWCIGPTMAALLLCAGCNAVPLGDRRIVKALFFEQTRAECMATLLLQQQDEDSDVAAFGRGKSFAEALYSAQGELDGEVFYGTAEIAAFPYECGWSQAETIGELLYDKVAPIPEISVFALDKPLEQGNKNLYSKQFERMKEAEREYKFHWGLETVFAEENECILPFVREEGYGCVVMDKRGSGNRTIQTGLEAQILAVLNGHGAKINAEPSGIDAAVEADAHIEHSRAGRGSMMTLVLDNVKWTALQDDSQDRKAQEKALVNEVSSIFTGNRGLFEAQVVDPFHVGFFSKLYGTEPANTSLAIILNYDKPENAGQK